MKLLSDPYFVPRQAMVTILLKSEMQCPYCASINEENIKVNQGDIYNCTVCLGDYSVGWINDESVADS